ncbi:MAG: glycosyltransferase [Acidobacteriota bacterium]
MTATANLDHASQLSRINLGIVCPMANESTSAPAFVKEVLHFCQPAGFQSITFFAVLDRASKDNTLELLRAMERDRPELHVVWAPENRSVVDAYLRGYQEALNAGGDWILEIDAGYSHQPSDIPQFFTKMAEGYSCVFGSRFGKDGSVKETSIKRRIVSRGGTVLANFLLGTKLSDMTSGFELFSRSALQEVLDKGVRSRGPFFQTEIKAHCRRLPVAEVPIQYRAASHNLNSASLKDAFSNLWRLFRLRASGRL